MSNREGETETSYILLRVDGEPSGCGRVSRGSCLIDVFLRREEGRGECLRMRRRWELDGTLQREGGRALKWGRRGQEP